MNGVAWTFLGAFVVMTFLFMILHEEVDALRERIQTLEAQIDENDLSEMNC